MKTVLINVLALVVIGSLALPMIGSTMATWSDSEISMDNEIVTGSLDLLVAHCGENWETPGPFNEDLPWGVGVDPCFNIPEIVLNQPYSCYLLLWNAGFIDGVAYLHIKNLVDNGLANTAVMEIWFDRDGKPETPLELIETGIIADLACRQIELGLLTSKEKGAIHQLKLEIVSPRAPADASLSFVIVFELVQAELYGPRYAWADTECSPNALNMLIELGGTPGFWSSPGAVKNYDKEDIVSWFKTIVWASDWFEDDLAIGNVDEVYDKMVSILDRVGAAGYTGMVNQFRAQYLATRLNTKPDPPRLQLGTVHEIGDILGAEAYLGGASLTLEDIIAAIEGKASGPIFEVLPERDQMEIMKNVCDKLNNP